MFRPLGHFQVDSKNCQGKINLKLAKGPKHVVVSFKELINIVVLDGFTRFIYISIGSHNGDVTT
jgi:hypothetical protein